MNIQVMCRALLLRPLVLALLLICVYGLLAVGVRATYPAPVPQATPTPVPADKAANAEAKDVEPKKKEADARTIPWSDYQTALEKERGLLAAQVDRQERWLLGIGAFLVGLIAFLFGQTRRDVVAQMREDVTQRINAQVEREIELAVRTQLAEKVKASVAAQIESHFKQQPIRWLGLQRDAQVNWVCERLAEMGFSDVKHGADFSLSGARIAIVSYARKPVTDKAGKPDTEADEKQLAYLTKIATAVRAENPELPLIIACPAGHLTNKEEIPVLQGLIYVAANFDSTVLTQVLTLIHR